MAQELNNAGNGLKWNNVNINYYSFDFYKSILNKFASVKDRVAQNSFIGGALYQYYRLLPKFDIKLDTMYKLQSFFIASAYFL